MKAISVHITGFYRSSFHAYTTEVSVDSHRWRLGLRYSKFHDFYDQLVLQDKDFHAEFPPKGSLFFTPKPEERQQQLEVFLQQVLAYYAGKGYPTQVEKLLCDLLKVPRHLRSPEHEDDDASTSTESVLDEPMHEPLSTSDSLTVEEVAKQQEETAAKEGEQILDQDVELAEVPTVVKEVEKVAAPPDSVQPASPVAEEPRPVEQAEAPVAHEAAKEAEETPIPAEEAEAVEKAIKEDVNAVEQEAVQEEEAEPTSSSQVPSVEHPEEANTEEAPTVKAVTKDNADEAPETRSEEPKVPLSDEQPVFESTRQEREPARSALQAVNAPAVNENTPPKEDTEPKELATGRSLSSWIAACLPKSLLRFIRRRYMKKTNLVVLCVALLLPVALARR